MADEIYINLGYTTQQPYQGQVTVNGQEPNIRAITGTTPANSQTPFPYSFQSPFTYQSQKNKPTIPILRGFFRKKWCW